MCSNLRIQRRSGFRVSLRTETNERRNISVENSTASGIRRSESVSIASEGESEGNRRRSTVFLTTGHARLVRGRGRGEGERLLSAI